MAVQWRLQIIALVTCCFFIALHHALIIRHEKNVPRANSHHVQQISSPGHHKTSSVGDEIQSVETENGFHEDEDVESESTTSKMRHADVIGKKVTKTEEETSTSHHHPHSHRHKDSSDLKQSTTHVLDHMTSRSRMSLGLNKGLAEIKKANEHYLKVHHQARCKVPKLRVIKVKEYYPDPSKEYLPSCTLLHRCGEDTGCCESETMQCVAKKREVIELHFYKLYLGNMGDGVGINRGDTVEKLSFYNDTECECQPTDDRPRFHFRKSGCLQCPSEFTLREISKEMGGGCSCDCFDKQKSCIKIKRGRESLPELDRRCVDARRCHPPECEYGLYDHTLGRCPKKNEKRNHSVNNSHHDNWWRYDGRD